MEPASVPVEWTKLVAVASDSEGYWESLEVAEKDKVRLGSNQLAV